MCDIFKILEILFEFFWNPFGMPFEFFLEFFWNPFGMLLEFFWNPFGIAIECLHTIQKLHPQTQCFVLKGLISVAQNCCHQSVHFTELAHLPGERVNYFRPSAYTSLTFKSQLVSYIFKVS